MSQNAVSFAIDPSGVQLLDNLLTPFQQNVLTCNSGTSRPSYAVAGTDWVDTTTTPWVYKKFNGTNDIVMGYIDPTGLTFTPSIINSAMVNFVKSTTVALARTELGLGTAATQASSAFDASGAAAAVLSSSVQKSGDTMSGLLTANGGINGTGGAVTVATQALTDSSTKAASTKFVKDLFSPITNSLSADVALANTNNYYDGPSVAQGTDGTWFVSGTVTITSNSPGDNIHVILWDGTTIIASCKYNFSQSLSPGNPVSLSGYIASPAGNLRMSCRDVTTTTNAKILYNASGNSKDSSITAIRIG